MTKRFRELAFLSCILIFELLFPEGAAAQPSATANVQSLSVEVDVDYYGGDYRTFAPQKPDANECRAAEELVRRLTAWSLLHLPCSRQRLSLTASGAISTKWNPPI